MPTRSKPDSRPTVRRGAIYGARSLTARRGAIHRARKTTVRRGAIYRARMISEQTSFQVYVTIPKTASGVLPSEAFFIQATRNMLRAAKVSRTDLSLVFLNGRNMRALNRRVLGHDFVTDVITFDLGSSRKARVLEGEICICPSEARRNARAYGEPFDRELLRYIAHGILHLQGHGDATPQQRAVMRVKEDSLLGAVHSRS